VLTSIAALTLLVSTSCTAEPQIVTETVTEIVTEVVTETVTEIVVEEKMSFEEYLEISKKREPWPEPLGEGIKVGWAQNTYIFPFCVLVEESLVQQLKWAGVAEEDIFIVNNNVDPNEAVKNVDILIGKNPDIYVEYQFYANVNEIIAMKFKEAGIPGVSVDIPIPGTPYVCVNNWVASWNMGQFAADALDEKWGSADEVDLFILCAIPDAGDELMKRTLGAKEVFMQRYGPEIEDKIVIANTYGAIDVAKEEISRVLAAHPEAENFVVTHQNGENSIGGRQAFEEAGIDRDNYIATCMGDGLQGLGLVQDGTVDMASNCFPETYGDFIVPAIFGVLTNVLVPSFVEVPSVLVDKNNVDEIYIEMEKALNGEINPYEVIDKYLEF
jgi:ABC-type sugar transport system substrate-binding protein